MWHDFCCSFLAMKHYLIYIAAMLLAVLPVSAQEAVQDSTMTAESDSLTSLVLPYPQILLDMPNAHIEQDSMVTLLMEEKIAGINRGEQERAGYRVQIYSSNHPQRGKSEALKLEQRIKQEIAAPVYVIYATPSWKVRLGDFLTEAEAAEFRDHVKQLFPDLADYTYIVRDQVKIR